MMNRAAGRKSLFRNDTEYQDFEQAMAEAQQRESMRVLAWCLMPDHFHLVIWPSKDGQLGRFMQRLTIAHSRRFQERRRKVGKGKVYEGRYKSFPCQPDEHLLTLGRFIESNALRGELVNKAEQWPYSSLWLWSQRQQAVADAPELADWPTNSGRFTGRPRNWLRLVNQPLSEDDLDTMTTCANRGRPFGDDAWVRRVTKRMGLESTFRSPGRPRKG